MISGKTADKLYNKFALPIFLTALMGVIIGPAGYVYSQTPEGKKQIEQIAKMGKITKTELAAFVQNKKEVKGK